MLFVKVAEPDNPDEPVEIPVENEGHILMSTLTAQFPGACGLKFKTEQSSWRGVRVVEDKIYPPGEDKWDEKCTYIITYPKDSKRKGDDLDINSAKSRKIERKCVDLIVLGIPWKSTEDIVRRYFEQYGEVVLCEIKRDVSNNSKGFGFVRFKDYNNQCLVLGKKHFIDGRWCDVKIPNSQEPETSRKIFVGRLSESLTSNDLQDYFSQYGQVIDVYIPKPFRAFGFVTFVEAEVAQSLCGESHIIKGVSVHVSRADPKEDDGSHISQHSSHQPVHNSHRSNYYNSNSFRPSQSNDIRPNKFTPNNSYSNSSPHISSLNAHNSNIPSIPSSTSMGFNKFKKYDHNHHHHHQQQQQHQNHNYQNNHANNNEFYDRHNDIRSPKMAHNYNHHASHHHHHHGTIGSNGLNTTNGFNNNDQMNAMMNMFNPMMAAFIQQLASQSNLLPPLNQQSQTDPHNNSAGVISAVNLGHHSSTTPNGVPAPPWNTNTNGTVANNPISAPNPINGSNTPVPNNIVYNSRYKEKNF